MVLSCFAKKVPKECAIGEGLSRNSHLRTAPPLCTPPAHYRRCGLRFRSCCSVIEEGLEKTIKSVKKVAERLLFYMPWPA